MSFDFNASPLRISGLFPSTPLPLEVSIYGFCTLECSYCFANLNRRAHAPELNEKNSTASLFRAIDRHIANPTSAIGHFLRRNYPIVFSNTTDPFQRDEKTYRSSEAFLQWAKTTGRSLFIQTKGNVLHDEWGRYSPLIVPGKDVVYISISQMDDAIRRRNEPGALSIPKRFELMRALSDRGVPVIAAVNPYTPEWIPSPVEFVERCAAAGARMLFMDALHLTRSQTEQLKRPYQETLPMKANAPAFMAAAMARQWQSVCKEFGLHFFAAPHIIPPTEMSEAYCYSGPAGWFGKNPLLNFVSAILTAVERKAIATGKPVLLSWPCVERFLREYGVENPLLNRDDFWYSFNTKISADFEVWKAAMPKLVPFYEMLRYWWNQCQENSAMVWVDSRLHIVYHEEQDVMACDSDNNLVGAFCPTGTGYADGRFPYGPEIDRCEWLYEPRPRKR